jgi:hypothetical protein
MAAIRVRRLESSRRIGDAVIEGGSPGGQEGQDPEEAEAEQAEGRREGQVAVGICRLSRPGRGRPRRSSLQRSNPDIAIPCCGTSLSAKGRIGFATDTGWPSQRGFRVKGRFRRIALFGWTLASAFTAIAGATPVSAAVAATPAPGYDISWPQCGGPYPANPAFGIVGVNNGIVFSANPCLASEIAWGGGSAAGLYANTGNPGPALSKHWPNGQSTPRFCDPATPDTVDCAFDYGYNAAADSFADARDAFAALGSSASPGASAWWLDVETSNSWRSDVELNVAALQGEAAYLGSVGVSTLGIYSTQYQWNVITGGSSAFASSKSWVAGAPDAGAAAALCGGAGFTGGGVALAQYISSGFDADIRCSDTTPVLTTIAVSPTSASVAAGGSQQFAARGNDQFGQPMSIQPSFAWAATGGTVSQSGLFTAGSTTGGPFTVTAAAGGVSGSATVTVTAATGDFSISASPATQTIKRGGVATYAVSVARVSGFSGSVSWSLAGQPSGSSVTFSPNPATVNATLAVRVPQSARGSYTLTITGTSGSLVHRALVTLKIAK